MAADKILIVDDEKYIRDVLASLLVQRDWQVEVAKDGLEALEKLSGDDFSVVLSDIRMPRMDGFALLRSIKQDYPDVAVVIMTGYNQASTLREAISLGAEGFVPKPFRSDEVTIAVQLAKQRGAARMAKNEA